MSTIIEEKVEKHTMQCMEIWGGNQAIDSAISVTGIDAWVHSQPYAGEAEGGDIHYVSMCGGGKLSRFAVADVSGHGQSVAHLADRLRSLMRKHINRLDQTRFAQALNREFSTLAAEGVFATALLTSYYAPTDHLVICNAGHPAPLWYQVVSKTWKKLESDVPDRIESISNLPLGVIEPTEYEQFAVKLEKDDLVLMYTDSLIEATNPQGQQLGEDGLLDVVRQLNTNNPGRFSNSLLGALTVYRGQAPPEDDLTVLLLHHNAADPPEQTFGDKMKVMGKMFGLVKA